MPIPNSIVALIPARAGSKRIVGKNIRPLAGHPLLAYTIAVAQESGAFHRVMVSSEDDDYGAIAERYGALFVKRSLGNAVDDSPDFFWVQETMSISACDAFAILRPTSPFRTADSICRAWAEFQAKGERFDSLRAVDGKPKQHPWKMWLPAGEGMIPLFSDKTGTQPSHSVPTQLLRQVWPQNASLEIAWTKTLKKYGNISGERVLPFFTEGYEGFDLNTEDDWQYAEWLIQTGRAKLLSITGVVSKHQPTVGVAIIQSIPAPKAKAGGRTRRK